MSHQNQKGSIETLKELTVHGFIRKFYDINQISNDLLTLCLSFYLILIDEWDLNNMTFADAADLNINEEDKTISSSRSLRWLNVFGSITVKTGQYQTWTIDTAKNEDNICFWALFGIIDVDYDKSLITNTEPVEARWWRKKSEIMRSSFCNKHICSYGYYSMNGDKWTNGIWEDYGISWTDYDDIISMKLDMTGKDKGTLSYTVDGQYQGIAFNNIDLNKSYRMIFGFYSANDTVKLIDESIETAK